MSPAPRRPADTHSREWFEEWFDNDLYRKLYRHRGQDEADTVVDLILESVQLPTSRPADVLDLGAGPGRHAVALAERGCRVTAVDLSRSLLAHAEQEAADAGVEIRLVRRDMRAISFSEEFDLVVQLFTSFGYFSDENDDRLVVGNVRRALRPGGSYVLDLINREHLSKTLVRQSARLVDGVHVAEQRRFEGNRVVKDITFEFDGEPRRFTESVRLFGPDEIDHLLRAAGFEPARWLGGYDGSEFDPNSSSRMIVICRSSA